MSGDIERTGVYEHVEINGFAPVKLYDPNDDNADSGKQVHFDPVKLYDPNDDSGKQAHFDPVKSDSTLVASARKVRKVRKVRNPRFDLKWKLSLWWWRFTGRGEGWGCGWGFYDEDGVYYPDITALCTMMPIIAVLGLLVVGVLALFGY